MNKNGLVALMAEKAGITQKEAERALDSTIHLIKEELVDGGKVTLMGFGNFCIHKRKARTGRNPKTGAEVAIKARNIPKFHAGKLFLERLNAKA